MSRESELERSLMGNDLSDDAICYALWYVKYVINQADGSGVVRIYPFPLGNVAFSKPALNRSLACSSVKPGTTMHFWPEFQFAGVATLWLAVSWRDFNTRIISSKFRPVVAGYKSDNFNFLSGPMMKTARAVSGIPDLSNSSGSSILSWTASVRSSAIIGNGKSPKNK